MLVVAAVAIANRPAWHVLRDEWSLAVVLAATVTLGGAVAATVVTMTECARLFTQRFVATGLPATACSRA